MDMEKTEAVEYWHSESIHHGNDLNKNHDEDVG